MGYTAEIRIPKDENYDNLMLYIYRSLNADDINTISNFSNNITYIK